MSLHLKVVAKGFAVVDASRHSYQDQNHNFAHDIFLNGRSNFDQNLSFVGGRCPWL